MCLMYSCVNGCVQPCFMLLCLRLRLCLTELRDCILYSSVTTYPGISCVCLVGTKLCDFVRLGNLCQCLIMNSMSERLCDYDIVQPMLYMAAFSYRALCLCMIYMVCVAEGPGICHYVIAYCGGRDYELCVCVVCSCGLPRLPGHLSGGPWCTTSDSPSEAEIKQRPDQQEGLVKVSRRSDTSCGPIQPTRREGNFPWPSPSH